MQQLLDASDAGEPSKVLPYVDERLIATKDILSNGKKKKFAYETSTSRCMSDEEYKDLPCSNWPSDHRNNRYAINQDCSKPIMLKHLLVHVAVCFKVYDKFGEVKSQYEKVASVVSEILRQEKYVSKVGNKVVNLRAIEHIKNKKIFASLI